MLKFTTHTRFMFWFSVFGLTDLGFHEWIESIQVYMVLCILDVFYIHACFNFLDKLSLICLFMYLVFWYFDKTYFGIKRQKLWYVYVSCILDLCPYATCLIMFKYHVFVFLWVLGKIRFPIEKIKFDKIQFLVFGKKW